MTAATLPDRARVVIIGSGIIGAAVACMLTRSGADDVVVLEKGRIGAQGATADCLGGLRTQFATAVNIRFSLLSREVYRRFEADFGVDPLFKRLGYLFLAASREHWAVLEHTAALMAALHTPVELLTPLQIQQRWPFIRTDDLTGGSYTADDGFYGPMEVLQAYVRAARRGGALFFENTAVSGFSLSGRSVRGVRTAGGHEIRVDTVVNAAGPWSGRVAAAAGLKLPVEPLKRFLFLSDACSQISGVCPLILDIDSGWYLKREGGGFILGGPPGSHSFDRDVPFDAEAWTASRSMRRVPLLAASRIVRGWAGHYEVTPDRHAVIGTFPELANFICATGFSGHGFQHAPAAARVVTELIMEGRARSADIHLLRPTRFREDDLVLEPLTAFRTASDIPAD